jgi:DNA-binding NtrC family response regulator
MSLPQPSRRRVLVVEDDRMVRDTIAQMLDDDYDVATADSVGAALAYLQAADASAIDLVLLDCLIPSGKVADVMTAADRQAIPVVLTSGDPGQAEAAGPTRCFLPKPFSHATLLSVLDSARR